MRKALKNDKLSGRPAARTFVALSLAASLAAFGCTTNRTPGNGDPVNSGPGAGPAAPTSGVNSGSSSGNTAPVNPPMMSSSTYGEALPTVDTRARRLPLSADEAAAVMAGSQAYNRRVRVLGPVNPGNSGRQYLSDQINTNREPYNPALQVNPIATVNSSVNSAMHVGAISGGDAGAVDATGALLGAVAVNGTSAVATTATPATTAAVTGTAGIVTPTTAAVPFSAGAFAAGPGSVTATTAGTTVANASTGTFTPTTAAASFPTPTVATSRIAANTGTVRAAGTTVTSANGTTVVNGTTITNSATTSNATSRSTATTAAATTGTTAAEASANVTSPVRVTQDANGKVIVTNATAKSQ